MNKSIERIKNKLCQGLGAANVKIVREEQDAVTFLLCGIVRMLCVKQVDHVILQTRTTVPTHWDNKVVLHSNDAVQKTKENEFIDSVIDSLDVGSGPNLLLYKFLLALGDGKRWFELNRDVRKFGYANIQHFFEVLRGLHSKGILSSLYITTFDKGITFNFTTTYMLGYRDYKQLKDTWIAVGLKRTDFESLIYSGSKDIEFYLTFGGE